MGFYTMPQVIQITPRRQCMAPGRKPCVFCDSGPTGIGGSSSLARE